MEAAQKVRTNSSVTLFQIETATSLPFEMAPLMAYKHIFGWEGISRLECVSKDWSKYSSKLKLRHEADRLNKLISTITKENSEPFEYIVNYSDLSTVSLQELQETSTFLREYMCKSALTLDRLKTILSDSNQIPVLNNLRTISSKVLTDSIDSVVEGKEDVHKDLKCYEIFRVFKEMNDPIQVATYLTTLRNRYQYRVPFTEANNINLKNAYKLDIAEGLKILSVIDPDNRHGLRLDLFERAVQTNQVSLIEEHISTLAEKERDFQLYWLGHTYVNLGTIEAHKTALEYYDRISEHSSKYSLISEICGSSFDREILNSLVGKIQGLKYENRHIERLIGDLIDKIRVVNKMSTLRSMLQYCQGPRQINRANFLIEIYAVIQNSSDLKWFEEIKKEAAEISQTAQESYRKEYNFFELSEVCPRFSDFEKNNYFKTKLINQLATLRCMVQLCQHLTESCKKRDYLWDIIDEIKKSPYLLRNIETTEEAHKIYNQAKGLYTKDYQGHFRTRKMLRLELHKESLV